jgi:hypothetical protein
MEFHTDETHDAINSDDDTDTNDNENYYDCDSFKIEANNLYIYDDNIYSTLIKYILERYQLDHDKMNGLHQGLTDKSHYDFEDDPYEDHFDIKFNPIYLPNEDDDSDSDSDKDNDNKVNFDKDYIIDFIYKDNGIVDLSDDDDYNIKLINDLNDYLSTKSLNELIITNINNLSFYNVSGVNTDPRGIRRLDWKIPFNPSYEIKDNAITLASVRDAIFNIKSHKFENWYEGFFGDVTVAGPEPIEIIIRFDHGS